MTQYCKNVNWSINSTQFKLIFWQALVKIGKLVLKFIWWTKNSKKQSGLRRIRFEFLYYQIPIFFFVKQVCGFVCVCVCVYYIYVCVCVYIHICIHACILICVGIYTHTLYVYMQYTYTYVCVYTHTYMYTHICCCCCLLRLFQNGGTSQISQH